ncbi:MAG: hypothetical protein GWO08_23385, partial [Gammaproteobacteria bacterium]|nr:hypothetical protein [candidate division Zixibacteria bacterium]NIR96468.1 hypothetical protein [Gammaproteobacteria bacterium]NIT56607.1 hypothetical protein [Fodinibius sp.]NIW44591.1 hypothetical protein [Gammaproteobacteria bacterium]NIY25190.1 hypothetical protein [Fodinibius sp.]
LFLLGKSGTLQAYPVKLDFFIPRYPLLCEPGTVSRVLMDKTRTRLLISVLWISGFVLLAIAPLPWLLLGERPPGTVFAWDFAVG